MEKSRSQRPLGRIQQSIFRAQMLLIVLLTGLITVSGIFLNLYYEGKRLDENLQNVAETIASSRGLQDALGRPEAADAGTLEHLDMLLSALSGIDVISVVGADGLRHYHSNRDYLWTVYDGTIPEFIPGQRDAYAVSDTGPSGVQRRAYAAVYTPEGDYLGFVMAVALRQNIWRTTVRMLALYLLPAAAAVLLAVVTSIRLSAAIRRKLMGYEPDAFSAMYKIRDNILESLEEGILAIDGQKRVAFVNRAAAQMLRMDEKGAVGKPLSEIFPASGLGRILETGERELNVPLWSIKEEDVVSEQIPIVEEGKTVGAAGIFRNRTEYTRLMEELSGVRYMVDSMRANNHDFTNKLHVILGLIQMGRYEEAEHYIMNVTMVQRETIHAIMEAVEDPSVAALLIGKQARASELNIRFRLKSGSRLQKKYVSIPSGVLVTVLGNLLDNAMEAMNTELAGGTDGGDGGLPGELTVGIFTEPGAMLITVDDNGSGILPEDREHIFEKGFSTKGEGRGTGLAVVSELVSAYGGAVTVESEPGEGTAFLVSFAVRTGEGGHSAES